MVAGLAAAGPGAPAATLAAGLAIAGPGALAAGLAAGFLGTAAGLGAAAGFLGAGLAGMGAGAAAGQMGTRLSAIYLSDQAPLAVAARVRWSASDFSFSSALQKIAIDIHLYGDSSIRAQGIHSHFQDCHSLHGASCQLEEQMHQVACKVRLQGLRAASRWRPVMAGLAAAAKPGALAAILAAGLAAAGPGALAASLAAGLAAAAGPGALAAGLAAAFFGTGAGTGAEAGFLGAGLAGMGAGAAVGQM